MTLNKVKDQSDLARDPQTGSIVNVNNLDYEKYVASRKVKNAKTKQVTSIEEDHLDIYGDFKSLKESFHLFANKVSDKIFYSDEIEGLEGLSYNEEHYDKISRIVHGLYGENKITNNKHAQRGIYSHKKNM